MIDITLQIVTKSATHDTDNEGGRHLGGEIVGVHPRIAEAPSRNRLGFGHINDVPIGDHSQLNFLCQANVDADGNIISRGLWRVDSTLLTADTMGIDEETNEEIVIEEGELSQVIRTNQLTADWTRFKEVCKNVVTGLNLTDEDII